MSKQSAFAKFVPQVTQAAVPPESTPAPAVAEAPAVPAIETPKPDDLQSTRLAIFAKKEASFWKEKEQFKKDRESWLKEKEEADQYRAKGREFDEIAKKDKIAALKLIGWSDTDIMNAIAESEKTEATPEEIARKAAQEETQKFRDEIAKEKAEAEKNQNERLVAKLRTDIGDKIKSDPEKLEYCAFYSAEAEAQAYEIIVENLKTNGELLSVDEALEITEELYQERDKAMSGLKKRQPKVEPVAEAPAKPAMRTRTNVGQAPVSNVPQQVKPKPAPAVPAASTVPKRETHDQKKARLIAALKNGGL